MGYYTTNGESCPECGVWVEWQDYVPLRGPISGLPEHRGNCLAGRYRAELAIANMRLKSMEQQRDSARKIARALYRYWLWRDLEGDLEVTRVLAEEAHLEQLAHSH